jgi:putative hydrolase of HD superfamily
MGFESMEAKSELPLKKLPVGKFSPFIEAYFEFNHLKQLYRQGWLQRGIPKAHCESVAEHSFGAAILAMWMAEACCPELDVSRVVRMALIHDFGEIYAGDLTPEDGVPKEQKRSLESKSVAQVFEKLPNGGEYLMLWEECEAGVTPEARFVREIDRLEMAMQAGVYGSLGYENLGDFFTTTKRDISTTQLLDIVGSLEDQYRKEYLTGE